MLLRTGQGTFLRLVPWLLLIASLLFAASSPIAQVDRAPAGTERHCRGSASLCAAVRGDCWWRVFTSATFGAGAGFLIMAVLAIFGIQSIREVNALKVVATTIANGIAVMTFIVERQIVWHLCLLMMLTAALGGYLGGHYSRRFSAGLMRAIVVVIGLGVAAYFFLALPSCGSGRVS